MSWSVANDGLEGTVRSDTDVILWFLLGIIALLTLHLLVGGEGDQDSLSK